MSSATEHVSGDSKPIDFLEGDTEVQSLSWYLAGALCAKIGWSHSLETKGSRRECNGDGGRALASAGQLDYHR